ncbi:hypothetical protein ACWGCW_28135 [Streptomyces sp. NPDC054933]
MEQTAAGWHLRHPLVSELAAKGAFADDLWRDALLHVDRGLFARPIWQRQPDDVWERIDIDHPDWAPAVWSDTALVTDLSGWSPDDGARLGTEVPTAWIPAPGALMRITKALDAAEGHRILHLGAGDGYTAALLATRYGGETVATVEGEPKTAGRAAARLVMARARSRVVIGDARLGVEGEQADRILSTWPLPAVPRPWLRQIRPGGRIVMLLATGLHGHAVAVLTVDEHGGAHGQIVSADAGVPAEALSARALAMAKRTAAQHDGELRRSDLLPEQLQHNTVRFVLGLLLPNVVAWTVRVDRRPGLYVGHTRRPSWARVRRDGAIREGGPDRLWLRVEKAHAQWQRAGSPAPTDLTIRVHPNGKQTVCDDSGQFTARLPGLR